MKTIKHGREEAAKDVKKRIGCFLISIVTLAFLLLVFCVTLCLRYEAWLGNIPENSYSIPDSINRITLTPGGDFMRERTISWCYDTEKHDARVEYFRSDSSVSEPFLISLPATGELVESRAGKSFYYHARLSDLETGADYNYRVVSGDQTSDWKSFSMPSSGDTLRFIYMGDVQDEQGIVSDSLFALLKEKESNYDFLAFGGDQIERPMDKYWRIWYKSIGDWAESIPLVAVSGNHEYLKGVVYQLDSRWVAQHNYPENGPAGFSGRSYYIDFPLMRMIIIDSNAIHWPYGVTRHYAWLEKILKETTQPWKVVMFHHSVYPVREGRTHPLMRYLFLPLLKEYEADLILQGHDHAYSRVTTKVEGDTVTPVFVISNVSPKFYRNGFDPVHDRLGAGFPLYQKIQVTQNELKYQSLFFDGKPYDDLTIERTAEGRKKLIDNAREWDEVFRFDGFGETAKGRKKKDEYILKIKQREAGRQIGDTNIKHDKLTYEQ